MKPGRRDFIRSAAALPLAGAAKLAEDREDGLTELKSGFATLLEPLSPMNWHPARYAVPAHNLITLPIDPDEPGQARPLEPGAILVTVAGVFETEDRR